MQRNEDVEDLDLVQREPTLSPVSSDDEFDPQDKDDDSTDNKIDHPQEEVPQEATDEDLELEKLGQREPAISPLLSDDEFFQNNPQNMDDDLRDKMGDPQEKVPQQAFTPLAKHRCKRTIKK